MTKTKKILSKIHIIPLSVRLNKNLTDESKLFASDLLSHSKYEENSNLPYCYLTNKKLSEINSLHIERIEYLIFFLASEELIEIEYLDDDENFDRRIYTGKLLIDEILLAD